MPAPDLVLLLLIIVEVHLALLSLQLLQCLPPVLHMDGRQLVEPIIRVQDHLQDPAYMAVVHAVARGLAGWVLFAIGKVLVGPACQQVKY